MVVDLISSGRLCQVLGGATRKAQEAVAVFVLGMTSRTLSEERVDLVGTWLMTSSERYTGWWCRHTLNVNEATLYIMRCLTCTQCRVRRRWVVDEWYGASKQHRPGNSVNAVAE